MFFKCTFYFILLHIRCDKNGDGQIDYHEFALHLSRKQHPSASLSKSPHNVSSTTRQDFRDPATQRYPTVVAASIVVGKKIEKGPWLKEAV